MYHPQRLLQRLTLRLRQKPHLRRHYQNSQPLRHRRRQNHLILGYQSHQYRRLQKFQHLKNQNRLRRQHRFQTLRRYHLWQQHQCH